MYSIFFVFLTVFALTGSGLLIVKQLDRKNHLLFAEKLTVSFVIGTYAIYFGVYLVGAYRLDALSMWGLLIVCLGAGVGGWWQLSWSTIKNEARLIVEPLKSDKLASFFSFIALVLALSSLVQGLAPPNDYDSLNYHLSLPQHGVEFGKLIIPWGLHRGFELFPALGLNLSRFALAASGDGAAQLLHGIFGIIAAIAASLIAYRMGYSKYVVILSAIFFLAIRVVIWEMGTVEVDVALAAVTTLAVLVILRGGTNPIGGSGSFLGCLLDVPFYSNIMV